jgi:tetratricopeptide (TPR) repeat protein
MSDFSEAKRLYQAGRYLDAETACRGFAAREPRSVPALVLLGILCAMRGAWPEAIDLLRRASALQPRDPGILANLGKALRDSGQPAAAIDTYRRLLSLDPQFADGWMNLALAYADCRLFSDALAANARLIALRPRDGLAHYNQGNFAAALERHAEAVSSYATAATLRPADPNILYNLGNSHTALQDWPKAIVSYGRALAAKPNFASALINLGIAQVATGALPQALDSYRAALVLAPDNVKLLTNLGNALQSSGLIHDSVMYYRRALTLDPASADTHYNLGIALQELGRETEAAAHYERAIAIAPGRNPGAYRNWGVILTREGSLAEAADCYERALAIEPNDAELRMNDALLRLSRGDFARGWPGFEARIEVDPRSHLASAAPELRWDGQLATAKELHVITEHGFGDTIQFSRYGLLLKERGIRATLQCDAALVRLLREGDIFERVVPHAEGEALSKLPWSPLLSLPLAFGTTLSSIPAYPAYLRAEPQLAELWRQRLGARDGLRVGLAWQGNPNAEKGGLRGRSFPLSCAVPLAQRRDLRLIVLQKGAALEQVETFSARDRIVDLGRELDDGPDAFIDTAALMMNLDLVITSDTSIAHLAGALGVPVWVALNAAADWRFLRDRPDSPWYPSMRLFRQRIFGDWEPVFAAMAAELQRR